MNEKTRDDHLETGIGLGMVSGLDLGMLFDNPALGIVRDLRSAR